MPSHGIRITKITQNVLAPPPRSRLRKMSPKIQNRHMIQAKNRKNSSRAIRNDPLSLNIGGLSEQHSGRPVLGASPVCGRGMAPASTDLGEMVCPPTDEMPVPPR